MSAIPMQLVTGFLGSGKTTFLKNYLNKFAGSRKIGIIQNEFSEVNIDSVEIRQNNADFEILEVNNGSVFCVCLLGSFVGSLSAFIDQAQPDELILEASGMSDPLSIGQILQSPQLKQKVYLDRVWCLVDALNFKKISGLQTRVNHQIRIADVVILNKIDLLEIQSDDLVHLIKKLNPFAQIYSTSYANIDLDFQKSAMKFLPLLEKAENDRPDIQSQVIKSNRAIDPENLNLFLKAMGGNCIRSKGYINLPEKKKVFLQGSFGETTLQETEYFVAPTEFVLIGSFQPEVSFQHLFDKFCES